MFAKSVIALAAVAGLVNAAPVEKRGAPAGWAYGYLEDYDTYHVRYLALKCYDQKNTQFFQDCCRPMLSTETLAANRASYCVPSQDATNYVVSSLAAKAAGQTPASQSPAPAASASTTSSAASDDSDYCEDDSTSSAASTTSAAAPTTSAAAPTTTPVGQQRIAEQPSTTTTTTTTTTTPAWTPAPTTQAWTPAPTTAAPTTTKAPSSGGGGSHNGGYATYFYQGGNAGACGVVHGDYDMIVAIDHEQWGDQGFGSGSNTCNRWLTVTNTQNGKSVVAMVADVCPTCANGNSLDLSVGAFQAIADLSQGQVPISWSWN